MLEPAIECFLGISIGSKTTVVMLFPMRGPDVHDDTAIRQNGESVFTVIDNRVTDHDWLRPGLALIGRAHDDQGARGGEVLLGSGKRKQEIAVSSPDDGRPRGIIVVVVVDGLM